LNTARYLGRKPAPAIRPGRRIRIPVDGDGSITNWAFGLVVNDTTGDSDHGDTLDPKKREGTAGK
jgi:hypothetical protein